MSASVRDHNLKAAVMWGSGGRAYDEISRSVAGAIEHCVTRLNPVRGERVVDVATGTGFTSRVVARCGADVVGVDIAEGMLAAAREIATEQNLAIDYRLGDAEALPFGDGAFDAVISTFGVMFAPDQRRAAAELARVCRRGGCVAIAAWTPDSHAVSLRKV
jgi:ubiquinone/menaquinone biosynthesis C-methylase UbiE